MFGVFDPLVDFCQDFLNYEPRVNICLVQWVTVFNTDFYRENFTNILVRNHDA